MKKQIIKITRKALTALLVLFTAGTTMAQVHTLQLSMQNVTNPTPNTVEFEMWIKNMTPDSVSKLSFLQFGIDLPANIGNGGTLSCSKIAANPLLPATQQAAGSPAVQLQPATPTIRVAAQTTSEGLAAAIPSTGNGIWYGTYRITNTAAFAANAVMTFTPVVNSSPSTKTRTSVAAYVNGAVSGGTAFTVLGSTTLQSALRVLGIAQYPSITLNQPAGTCPTAGNANVTDPICFGGLGSASITLSPAPVPVSGSYSVDGGAPASYTTNPFTVGGLSQGTHTVTVTNNPNCAPFNVVFTVGGPSSIPTNTTTQSACDNYTWSVTGMNYTQSGTYTGTSVNTQGCTVNEVLDLTINLSGSSTQTATACDSYFWSQNGQTYTQSGTYTATGTTPAGCPDVHTLILTINNSTVNTQTETACDSYTWSVNNMMYTQSGTYTASGTNAAGCPSTDILVLTINNSITTNETASACGSYTWNQNNMTYTQSGTYTAVGTTAAGCQDLHILNLTINVAAPVTISSSNGLNLDCNNPSTDLSAGGGSTVWTQNGGFFGTADPILVTNFTNGPVTYGVTVTDGNGCTATSAIVINMSQPTSNTTTASACDTYTWSVNGATYAQSGTYTSVNGCHTEILDLTITPSTSNTTVASACDSYTWSVNNMMYSQSGTYTSVNGCNTEILDLTITPSTSNTTVASACDSYTWSVNNMMYSQSGTYTSVNGCNTEILDLTITPSTTNTTVASACDSYTWSVTGATYTQSGTYAPAAGLTVTITDDFFMDETTWVIKNSSNVVIASGGPYGFPSTGGTAVVNVNPSASDYPVTFEIESFGFFNDNQPNYSIVCNTNSSVLVSGTCVGTFWGGPGSFTSGALNCAAAGANCVTEVLDLTITPSTSNTTVASACDSYTWSVNNMMYTQSGTYTSVNGCHTEILDLTITPSTSNTTVASACDSYTWSVDNMMYTQSGTYTSVNGCHTEILDLTITPSTSNTTVASACDSYTWSVNNMMYTQSGTYTSVNGCNTEILVLTLGQSTSSTITANASLSYTWTCNNVTYTQSGTYTCTGVNATGCPDVQTLILTISGCNLNVTTANASGCPNSPITLTGSPAGGTWSVANPYIGPSTTFTYTYTDPNTGCTGTATGTITVANLAAVTITSVTVTGPTTATVNWAPVAGLSWYEVRYRPIGSGSWTGGGTQAAPTTFKNLIGLVAGTTYEVEVRGFCSLNNPGPWGSNTVFTTSGACGTPTGLFAAPVTGTTAKLNYVAVPGATHYQFRMRKVGVLAWSSAGTQAAPATSKTITGLSLSTQYEWQMRAVCNGAASAWSAIDMFTTLASKESVDFATETINNNVSVYPNPVRDVLTVEVTTEVAQNTVVKVFDMSGRLVKQIQANAEIGVNNIAVNLSDVSAGVYQVQVFANDKLTHISKVSKQD
jgi:hypothetical protein